MVRCALFLYAGIDEREDEEAVRARAISRSVEEKESMVLVRTRRGWGSWKAGVACEDIVASVDGMRWWRDGLVARSMKRGE